MGEQAGNRKKWEEVAEKWGKINPPYTPSIGELKIYEKWMERIREKRKNPKMLVLGATPSLRELGYRLGFEVTCVDINPKMIEETDKLIQERNTNERIIIGSWLTVEFPEESFDIIVGDHSTNNVDFKEWPKLFSNIKRFLKKDGIVILGATVFEENQSDRKSVTSPQMQFVDAEKLEWETLIERIKKNPELLDNRLDRWNLRYGFHSHPEVRKEEDRTYNVDLYDAGIDRLYKQGKITAEECNKLKFKIGKWAAVFLSKKEFEGFAKNYFNILEVDYDRSHEFFKYQQFFIMKK